MSETRQVNSQVNGLHIDGDEYEIVDKLCYLGDMLSQEGGCEHAILKRIQTGWLKFMELSGLLIGKGMSLKSKGIIYKQQTTTTTVYFNEVVFPSVLGLTKRNYLYNMHKTCNVVWQ